jgi:hypothetical protein
MIINNKRMNMTATLSDEYETLTETIAQACGIVFSLEICSDGIHDSVLSNDLLQTL